LGSHYGLSELSLSKWKAIDMAIPQITTPLNPTFFIKDTFGNLVISGFNFESTSKVVIDGERRDRTINSAVQITAIVTGDITASVGPKAVTVVNEVDGASNEVSLAVTERLLEEEAVVADKKIGILSSIDFTGTVFEDSFILGLAHPSWKFAPPQENLGSNSAVLTNAAQTFLNDNNIDVIVTFGGNKIAMAVVAAVAAGGGTNKKVLSVIGNLTAELSGPKYMRGGVNLDTVTRNRKIQSTHS
jgi:hypothetical protein